MVVKHLRQVYGSRKNDLPLFFLAHFHALLHPLSQASERGFLFFKPFLSSDHRANNRLPSKAAQ